MVNAWQGPQASSRNRYTRINSTPIRQEAYSPKWREIVRLLYTHIEAEPIGDEITQKLLSFMKEHTRDNSSTGRSV